MRSVWFGRVNVERKGFGVENVMKNWKGFCEGNDEVVESDMKK
jgi:hypothetical protein